MINVMIFNEYIKYARTEKLRVFRSCASAGDSAYGQQQKIRLKAKCNLANISGQ